MTIMHESVEELAGSEMLSAAYDGKRPAEKSQPGACPGPALH